MDIVRTLALCQEKDPAVARPFPVAFPFLALLAFCLSASARPVESAQPAPVQRESPVRITIGQSVAPLYGPWKFKIGDSPLDPVTRAPLRSEEHTSELQSLR